MQKFWVAALTTMMLTLTSGLTVASSPQSTAAVTIHSESLVTDPHILLSRALNGISDPSPVSYQPIGTLTNTATGQATNLTTVDTTQYLKGVRYPDGSTVQSYATTAFTQVTPAQLSGYSQSYSGWDSSYSVEASSTFYYTVTTISGSDYMQLTNVTGGWTTPPTGISIQDQHVRFGATGVSPNGFVEHSQDEYPSGQFTWAYNAPGSWPPISVSNKTGRAFGVNSWINLWHGSTEWSLGLINTYDLRTTTNTYQ